MPPALDPEDPASLGNASSADFDVALCFAISGSRASATGRRICCHFGCAGHATGSGPRRSSCNGEHCYHWSCRGAVLRKPWRSSFISRICDCCHFSCAGRATRTGPRRSIFNGRHCEFGFCRDCILCDLGISPSPTDFASVVATPSARYFAHSGGRASSADRATAILAVLVALPALDQEDPASPGDTGRASPADRATAVAAALVQPSALDPDDPALPEDSATTDSVVALCFAIPDGRASTTDFASAAISSVLVVHVVLDQEDPTSPSP